MHFFHKKIQKLFRPFSIRIARTLVILQPKITKFEKCLLKLAFVMEIRYHFLVIKSAFSLFFQKRRFQKNKYPKKWVFPKKGRPVFFGQNGQNGKNGRFRPPKNPFFREFSGKIDVFSKSGRVLPGEKFPYNLCKFVINSGGSKRRIFLAIVHKLCTDQSKKYQKVCKKMHKLRNSRRFRKQPPFFWSKIGISLKKRRIFRDFLKQNFKKPFYKLFVTFYFIF